jgi:histidinol-phosphate/aromatic aminotransferase/cobyric acid decarboxylase-like protein
MRDSTHTNLVRKEITSIRDSFVNAIVSLGLFPYLAHGNFVLVKFDSVARASNVETHLRRRAILVRPMN